MAAATIGGKSHQQLCLVVILVTGIDDILAWHIRLLLGVLDVGEWTNQIRAGMTAVARPRAALCAFTTIK